MIFYISCMTDAADTVIICGSKDIFVCVHVGHIHPFLKEVDMHGVCSETFNSYRALAPQSSTGSPCVIIMATIAESSSLKVAVYVVIITDGTAIRGSTSCRTFTVVRMATCTGHISSGIVRFSGGGHRWVAMAL